MAVPTRNPEFTPPGEFSWVRAAAKSTLLWALNYGAVAVVILLCGLSAVTTRSGSPVEPAYALYAWTMMQGFYPLYHRATGASDDYIPQSPRFLRLLLLTQTIGLVSLALVVGPLSRIGAELHEPGSTVALLDTDPTAWSVFMLHALGMLCWPTASALFMLRMTAQPGRLLPGLLVGVPLFLVTFLGGLIGGWFLLGTADVPQDTVLMVCGLFGGTGLPVIAGTMLWFRASTAREPLGPPPANPGMFTGAVQPPSSRPPRS